MANLPDDDKYYLLSHRECCIQQKQLLPLDSVIIENPVKDEESHTDKFCRLLDGIFGSPQSYDTTVNTKKSPSSPGFDSNKENYQTGTSTKRYKCINCPKSFAHQWSKIYHQQICLGEVSTTCEECNKRYESVQGLRIHMKMHDVDNCFKCLQCERIFPLKRLLDVHMRRHEGEKPYQCDECKKTFASPRNLHDHKLTHSSERPFSCERCNKTFKFAGSLKLHMRAHNNERPFKCESCEKSFHNTSNLKRHSKIHAAVRSLDFECRHCDQAFFNSFTRRRHELIKHGGEKKYICSFCNKGFFFKAVMINHMQSHINERKFQCLEPGCNFASNWDAGLRLHHKHYHIGLRSHSCPTCQKSFKTKSHLKEHQNTHIIKGPFTCPVCPKEFETKAALKKHQVCHNTERFTCTLCQKSFSTPGHLKLHGVVHTRIKHKMPAVCTICHKELSNKGNLKTHMKNVHPESWDDRLLKVI